MFRPILIGRRVPSKSFMNELIITTIVVIGLFKIIKIE